VHMGLGHWIETLRKLSRETDESVRIGKQNKKAAQKLETLVKEEFRRRDIWALRDAEVQRLARGRKIWVIKCAAPDTKEKFTWGDYAYCLSLKSVIERMGYYVVLNCHEDWYEPVRADVVLVMRGRHPYHPDRRNAACRYLMWMVCHPDMVPDEEYELYDHIYVDSIPLAEELKMRLRVPVSGLIVGADMQNFCPAAYSASGFAGPESSGNDVEKSPQYGLVFVGNTRGERRSCVDWCEKYHIPVDIWGVGWKKFYKSDTEYLHFHGQAQYRDLPELYRNSAVILNDHFAAMRETGMVNNRMIEASACGCPIVSDYSPAYESLPGKITFYHGEKDFSKAVETAMENAAEWRKEAEHAFPELKQNYSMEACVRRMIADAE